MALLLIINYFLSLKELRNKSFNLLKVLALFPDCHFSRLAKHRRNPYSSIMKVHLCFVVISLALLVNKVCSNDPHEVQVVRGGEGPSIDYIYYMFKSYNNHCHVFVRAAISLVRSSFFGSLQGSSRKMCAWKR